MLGEYNLIEVGGVSIGILVLISTVIMILVFAGLLKAVSSKNVSGVKAMLLGINITLVGGIIAVDPNCNLGGVEYLIVLFGLIMSIFGAGKSN